MVKKTATMAAATTTRIPCPLLVRRLFSEVFALQRIESESFLPRISRFVQDVRLCSIRTRVNRLKGNGENLSGS